MPARTLEQMADVSLKNRIGGYTDRKLGAFGFEKPINLPVGKGGKAVQTGAAPASQKGRFEPNALGVIGVFKASPPSKDRLPQSARQIIPSNQNIRSCLFGDR